MLHDYYNFLLKIDDGSLSPAACLSKALTIIVEICGADIGYLEHTDANGKRWWAASPGEKEVESIREKMSSGVIAEAISSGETIVTTSAALGTKRERNARGGESAVVLCSPTRDENGSGAIYLQWVMERREHSENRLMDEELFTRHVSPMLQCLINQVFSPAPKYEIDGAIGDGEIFQRTLKEALIVANFDVTVLIKGETGSGKTHLARLIHENSYRRCMPFIHINCANLREKPIERESGVAFNVARPEPSTDIAEKITAASGGTLFLDESGDLPLSVQSELLLFLEKRSGLPIGSRDPAKPDVRIITASSVDFREFMKNGKFLGDLYYEISIFTIDAPPLRKRKDDIPALVRYFVEKYCNHFKTPLIRTPRSTVSIMRESDWPGNIRQLENTVQRAVLRAKSESSNRLRSEYIGKNESGGKGKNDSKSISFREERNTWEKTFILEQLYKFSWNISKTAKSLQLSRSHLNNLIKMHDLKRDA